jgi:hypothetical protein
MSILTIVALALGVVVVAVVLRVVVRGRREPQLPPGDIERTSASLDAEPAKPAPPTESLEPAKPAPPTEPPVPAEPAPTEPRRATIPPMVAEALASRPETAIESASAAAHAPAAAPAAAPADRAAIEAEDPERKKARKLARLFVSEIKLYNEKLVAEGLAAGDLYTHLKDPIDQSVVVFQRRVPEAVRAEFDYMHDELVRQLAGGDTSKLGPSYGRLRRG